MAEDIVFVNWPLRIFAIHRARAMRGGRRRFACKQGHSNSPMDVLIKEATAAGDGRPLLASGLFAGSPRGSYGSLTARQIRAEALWTRPALQ